MSELFMVFDVESIGLHGEGFAVGWVVIGRDGGLESEGYAACSPRRACGHVNGHEWIDENCGHLSPTCHNPTEVREAFWAAWLRWKERGAVLAADCAWPVEARFLIACVEANPDSREWSGPYPLIDVASVRLAAGLDPLGTNDRTDDEKPAHDPLRDARQSARLLLEALAARRPAPQSPGGLP